MLGLQTIVVFGFFCLSSYIVESFFFTQYEGVNLKRQQYSAPGMMRIGGSIRMRAQHSLADAVDGSIEAHKIFAQRLKKLSLGSSICLGFLINPAVCPLPVQAAPQPAVSSMGVQQAPFLTEQTKPEGMKEPTKAQVQEVVEAFRAFDAKKLDKAERLFSNAIQNWIDLKRPRDEMSLLYKARGNVRVDLKRFDEALEDYDKTIVLMAEDGENSEGLANYYEYPDAFVQRGLTFEGLGDWQKAVDDYSRAIQLWGGGRGPDSNPYVLTFRGNALTKLGLYKESLADYTAAGDIFASQQNIARETDSRANYALALYETGDKEGAVRIMKYITRKNPGYADMHVALAAHAWSVKDVQTAEKEWAFTCNAIDVGCRKYKDLEWVTVVRRWPPSLVAELKDFLGTQYQR